MRIEDLGLIGYDEAYSKQKKAFDNLVAAKKKISAGRDYASNEIGTTPTLTDLETIFLVEHYPVITLGRHADTQNLLLPEELLLNQGILVRHIERGGDVTYHGKGQLVVYPVIDLEAHGLGVKKYVEILEESVIRTISHWGIKGERVEGATGVWIGQGTADERKICAIGVKCSRFCTMHGLALNVNTDLTGFSLINPCGFRDKGVTSIEKETGTPVGMPEVKKLFLEEFLKLLHPAHISVQGKV